MVFPFLGPQLSEWVPPTSGIRITGELLRKPNPKPTKGRTLGRGQVLCFDESSRGSWPMPTLRATGLKGEYCFLVIQEYPSTYLEFIKYSWSWYSNFTPKSRLSELVSIRIWCMVSKESSQKPLVGSIIVSTFMDGANKAHTDCLRSASLRYKQKWIEKVLQTVLSHLHTCNPQILSLDGFQPWETQTKVWAPGPGSSSNWSGVGYQHLCLLK